MVDFQTNVTVLISVDGCYDLQFLCMLCNSYAMVPMYIIYIYIRLALWHNWVVNLLVLHELCSHNTHAENSHTHANAHKLRILFGYCCCSIYYFFFFFSAVRCCYERFNHKSPMLCLEFVRCLRVWNCKIDAHAIQNSWATWKSQSRLDWLLPF